MRWFRISMAASMLALCSCGSTGQAASDAEFAASDFISLELASMTLAPADPPSAAIPPRYGTTHILFRRLADASYIAVTETSRTHWATLAGPGSLPAPPFDAFDGARRPATGMTAEQVVAVLSVKRASGWRLVLPHVQTWQSACLAGSTTKFSWGSSDADAVVATNAVTLLANTQMVRTQDVGSKLGNAWGLRDMHGNVWEMISPAAGKVVIKGGACDQPATQCQVSNAMELPLDRGHPLVGFRIELVR